jgi:large subunit ribosomal protein L21
MTYAIIALGGKQYRVSEGERLLVDRLPTGEGETFNARVLFAGGDGEARYAPDDVTVTARVVGHVLGEKIRIGKYKPKSGYRKHTGYRSRLSQIEIESIGSGKRSSSAKAAEKPAAGKQPATAAAAKKPKAAEAQAEVKGLPEGYAEMTVADIGKHAKTWDRATLEAALEYERGHANRKGAISALESAIEKEES